MAFYSSSMICYALRLCIYRCILDECRKSGLGAECASLQEAKLALQLGAQMAQVYA
jgi:diaminopimelate decarboxylase